MVKRYVVFRKRIPKKFLLGVENEWHEAINTVVNNGYDIGVLWESQGGGKCRSPGLGRIEAVLGLVI